jgi:hypothetical protein
VAQKEIADFHGTIEIIHEKAALRGGLSIFCRLWLSFWQQLKQGISLSVFGIVSHFATPSANPLPL